MPDYSEYDVYESRQTGNVTIDHDIFGCGWSKDIGLMYITAQEIINAINEHNKTCKREDD